MASILFKRAIYHAAALNSLRPGAYARHSSLPLLSIMSPTIAIIGAGPCGLTLARLLECNNINYVVYERDIQSAPAQQSKAGVGGSLDLHPESGQKALQVAGLYDEFKRHARWDATGFVLATQEGEVKARVGEGRDAPEIDRHQLRQMLIDSVPPRKIQWEHGVKALERLGDGRFNVKFSNGQSVSDFKLVVGTDGAWSKVRPMLTSVRPVYSGFHFIEGRINPGNRSYDAARDWAGKGNSASLGSGKAVLVQQMADTSYRVYMGVRVPQDFARGMDDGRSSEQFRKDLLESPEFFAGWSDKLKRFIADAEGPFKPWSLNALPVEGAQWSHVDGVTLLGDAAHLSLPNGEGVNLAMHDALTLCEKIVGHCKGREISEAHLNKAVVEYEKEMFPRAKAHIADGDGLVSHMFADDAVEKWLQMFERGTHTEDFA